MPDEREAYMLRRDAAESARLAEQHNWIIQVFGGRLLHQTVPHDRIEAVADIGTGSGLWLHEFKQQNPHVKRAVGFDVSSELLPVSSGSDLEFAIHDCTKPFPNEYLGIFDLVHVRFLTYALKADVVDSAVKNIAALLKPGGFLQWQEGDVTDMWNDPETDISRKRMTYVVDERIARGLTSAFVPVLTDALQNLSDPAAGSTVPSPDSAHGKINALRWGSNRTFRILQLQTVSTEGHPSELVHRHKRSGANKAGKIFLDLGATRREEEAKGQGISAEKAQKLTDEAKEMRAIANDPQFETAEFNAIYTWIIARKTTYMPVQGPWIDSVRLENPI